MNTKAQAQYFNYLSIELLDWLGNSKPTQSQIDLMESLLKQVSQEKNKLLLQSLMPQELNYLRAVTTHRPNSKKSKLLNVDAETESIYQQAILQKLQCTSLTAAIFQYFCQDTLHKLSHLNRNVVDEYEISNLH